MLALGVNGGFASPAESYFVNVGDTQIEIPVPADAVMAKGLDARFDHMMHMTDSSDGRRLTYFVNPESASAIQRGDFTEPPKLMYIVSCMPVNGVYKSSDFASFQDRVAQTIPDGSKTLDLSMSSFAAKANNLVQEMTGINTNITFSKTESGSSEERLLVNNNGYVDAR
jgi:hypothetical protein